MLCFFRSVPISFVPKEGFSKCAAAVNCLCCAKRTSCAMVMENEEVDIVFPEPSSN